MTRLNLASYLEQSAIAHPNKDALIFEGQSWTFDQVNKLSNRLAQSFIEHGLQEGDRVTMYLPNCPEFIFLYFGILKAGGVVNPINTMLKYRELQYIIRDCKPKLFVTTYGLSEYPKKIFSDEKTSLGKMIVIGGEESKNIISYDNFLQDADIVFNSKNTKVDDTAAILYTSGTTGMPKGVMLTHGNLWTNSRHCADWAEATYKDITVTALPLFHSYALTHVLAEIWIEAGTIVLLPSFDSTQCLKAMMDYKATAFHGVATMYYALVNHPELDYYAKNIHLRYCVTGAAVTPEPILRAWNEKFTPLSEGYGITEGSPVVFMNPLPGKGEQKSCSCGLPIVPEIEVAAVDENGRFVEHGQIGELVTRGPHVMKGYWEKPAETDKTLRDGWLYTGDLVYFDNDGYCYVVDRKKDMITTGGFNIYPKEVEDLLYEISGIAEAQVVGIPDLEKGEIAVACVALKEGAESSQEEIIQFCKKNAAAYKAPRRVVFFEFLPKTATGKLEKVTLRKMVKEQLGINA